MFSCFFAELIVSIVCWTILPSKILNLQCLDFSFKCSVQFSWSAVSDSLWPHGLQHARPPCPSPASGVYLNSCSLSWGCYPIISSSVVSSPSPLAFNLSSIRVFSNESALCIRWLNYWSFSFNISPSNEYSWLVSFRMDWLDLLAVQGTLIYRKSAWQFQLFKKIRWFWVAI